MSLFSGDLTTPQRVAIWMGTAPTLPSAILTQLVGSMSALIYNKLNRARTYSQNFTRVFDSVGNMQLVLPDYPVTSITSLQVGQRLIPRSVIPPAGTAAPANTSLMGGYRYIPWAGDLPGGPAVIELASGWFYQGAQNLQVAYTAGYLISNEPWTVPATPFQVTVLQPNGICCRDNGVSYASGTPMTPVASAPGVGQYVPPPDATPGLYTFSSADVGAAVLISYSFVPADLEEACCQMVAERYSYRNRIGEISKSLGGQETIRWQRGSMGPPYNMYNDLPPEVNDLIQPYISYIPPAIGAPV